MHFGTCAHSDCRFGEKNVRVHIWILDWHEWRVDNIVYLGGERFKSIFILFSENWGDSIIHYYWSAFLTGSCRRAGPVGTEVGGVFERTSTE